MAGAATRFPHTGAWRLHRAPTQLSPRDHNPPRDRWDDPEHEYRVRYFATTMRGAMLEVLDHFRPNADTEAGLAEVDADGLDMLEEEFAGSVPDKWLTSQRFVRGIVKDDATFVDVTNAELLADLNDRPRIRRALATDVVIAALGDAARLDGSTIRMAGPAGRAITQAVSREIYEDAAGYAGVRYVTRFDDTEPCWAIFDGRTDVDFDGLHALSSLDDEHVALLNDVAGMYKLLLPANWRPDPRA